MMNPLGKKSICFTVAFSFHVLTGCMAIDAEKEALILKNEHLTVKFLPVAGGKIISFKDSKGNEYLSRSAKPYVKRTFGMKYGDTEFDGIDECFPSMGGCKYPTEPYKGKETGDHGELCQQPWQVIETSPDGKSATLQAKGVNFSYVFNRKATLEGKAMVLDYTVKNTGKAPLYHSYVFHPLFKGETGCFIEIDPGSVVKLLYSTKGFLGKMNTCAKFADLKDKDGKLFYKTMFTKDIGRYYKFIVGKLDKGEAVLKYADGTGIKLDWPADKMPFMAVWCSEDGVKGLNHLAPEPAVSAFDTLDQAFKAGEAKMIPAGGTEKWQIKISLTGK